MQQQHQGVDGCSRSKGDGVATREGSEAGCAHLAAFLHCDPVIDRPGEKGAEQDHPSEVAIDEKMRKRPALDGDQGRMAKPASNPGRRGSAGGERNESEPDQRHRNMTPPWRRRPYLDHSRGAIGCKAEDNESEPNGGDERIDELVAA